MRRVVEATGGIPGADGRDKNGDFVIVLDPAGLGRDCRVMVEAKDKPTQKLTGKDDALAYLSAAMRTAMRRAGVLSVRPACRRSPTTAAGCSKLPAGSAGRRGGQGASSEALALLADLEARPGA
jgi:hypothetical protein